MVVIANQLVVAALVSIVTFDSDCQCEEAGINGGMNQLLSLPLHSQVSSLICH